VSWRQELQNSQDLSYYGDITIGGQTLQGVYDTGSIELVVLSKKCSWCGNGDRNLYDSSKSSWYSGGNFSLVLTYGSGQLLGQEAYDKLSMGPYESEKAAFWEVVDAQMPLLNSSHFEALLGLGPLPENVVTLAPGATSNDHGYAVFVSALGLSQSMYSVCLGRTPGSSGYIIWEDNAVNTMPAETFTKLHVHKGTYWMAELTDIRIGEELLACSEGCGAILDSGTSLLSVPTASKDTLLSIVEKMGLDCTGMALPDLRFKLDGKDYVLPPDSYLSQVVGIPGYDVSDIFSADNVSHCQVSVMTADMDSSLGNTWIFGMPFFRSYYTLFAQRTPEFPPRMFTALASDTCTPIEGSASSLQSAEQSRRSGWKVRTVNASKIRVPLWLRKAKLEGRLQDERDTPNHKKQNHKANATSVEVRPHKESIAKSARPGGGSMVAEIDSIGGTAVHDSNLS